ncbi:SIR2 family NAD-dependent protein deacylase [Kutzneria albida]|uniref:protein acetyllysine N-acetyltransferase n=1 Tax=Kutzneria albida DSM 43870 TaxID=1449976 RepID=W5W540_9PSEU|nr:Sir2 family NAD-dependent protein deacetylase [Kutzneria albida]AHH96343.1 NAD-dependent deacetylase 2 [Kutzneria albida DSM 43870]
MTSQQALELVGAARRVCVLTGAGVSTDSGIPDFRGPNGVWTRDPEAERMFTLSAYLSDPDVRRRSWLNRAENPAWAAQPNAAHRALVELERSERLRALLTQNIDGLHQRAGSDPGLVVELHGSLYGTQCMDCDARGSMAEALDRVRAGEPDPPCLVCGGILKAATISFGQALDPVVLRRARQAALDCDLLLAAGSSLSVEPAAGLVGLAAKAGAAVVICNAEPTPYDEVADAVVREPLGEALPELVAARSTRPLGRFSTWGDPSTW